MLCFAISLGSHVRHSYLLYLFKIHVQTKIAVFGALDFSFRLDLCLPSLDDRDFQILSFSLEPVLRDWENWLLPKYSVCVRAS
ncbi:hypothetical protein, partial [Pseudomonas gingeri]|uniref:hypothetical protein n=1 Tax=Pseudomonas gingeri TaxID=117681 RepID=UPI001C4321D7